MVGLADHAAKSFDAADDGMCRQSMAKERPLLATLKSGRAGQLMAPPDKRLAEHSRAERVRLRKQAEGTERDSIGRQVLAIAYQYDDLILTVAMIERCRWSMVSHPR